MNIFWKEMCMEKVRKKLIREAYQYCLENFTYQARCKKVLDFIQK